MKNCKAAGTRREHQAMKIYKDDGWEVIRAPASIGAADFIALKAGRLAVFAQVKANKDGGPYKSFSPADRRELREVAERAGGIATLCWWPPHGKAQWIDEEFWPKEKVRVELDTDS